ncbi:MAG: thiol reductant ABC exporter subunit CydD [Actinobacteria bacterium 13_2_20CM_2_71_6]|nr:MAG: thiol reductant ABC exporter subunit CydD [Actinobacteria bacterium 13_2_20CM_2_71_6]
MGPVDPRLVRLPGMRGYLAAVTGSALVTALLVVAQADALARLLAAAVGAEPADTTSTGTGGGALSGTGAALSGTGAAPTWTGRLDRGALIVAGTVLALRAGQHALASALATRTAAAVKAGLRGRLLAAAAARGPAWLTGQRAGELSTVVGRGVDGLDGYLTGYLPQLVLAVTVPLAVLARLTTADLTSALVVGVTLPLIPVFAILVGWHTQARTQRQWRLLSRLGGHFLDMLSGMTTLRAFGRTGAQVEVVRAMAQRYRSATMATLRVAFLSALVLELVATVSVALVAVPIGLRLLAGSLTLPVALLVLLLAPEAYAPLRAAGARFHDSQEGMAALDEAFAVLDAPSPARVTARLPDPASAELVFDAVSARGLRAVSFRVAPGERVALVGPSGGGKSTILSLVLAYLRPDSGRILVGGVDLSIVDMEAWRARLAWVPQRPYLFAGSVAANIALAGPGDVEAAARAAQAHEFIDALPDGYETVLGERGYGLSSGQRQRIALARAYLRTGAPFLLLDEPTARLDPRSEAAVVASSLSLLHGRTALLVAHRPALVEVADRILRVDAGRVTESVPA